MNGSVRRARPDDAVALADLAALKREEYRHYQPIFWNPARDARDKHLPYLTRLIGAEQCIALVHEQDGQVTGFVIATLISAPPVIDPGGLVCLIDDFVVADPGEWGTVGRVLLREVALGAKERGAVQTVVVCGHLDEPKRAMLRATGHSIASEWYVGGV